MLVSTVIFVKMYTKKLARNTQSLKFLANLKFALYYYILSTFESITVASTPLTATNGVSAGTASINSPAVPSIFPSSSTFITATLLL